MTLSVVAGTARRSLANAVAAQLSVELSACEIDRFPDGEVRPVVAGVRGVVVFVGQPTGPLVVPYFGYGRQDRRPAALIARGRENSTKTPDAVRQPPQVLHP